MEKAIRFEDWIVLRFWENDIKHDVEACVTAVKEAIQDRVLSEYMEETYDDE